MNNILVSDRRTELVVNFNIEKGEIIVSGGATTPESEFKLNFLLDSLESYQNNPAEKTNVKISFTYFNTKSATLVWRIFKILEKIKISQKSIVSILWFVEADDEDLMESANEYQDIFPSLTIKQEILEEPCFC